MGFRLRFPYRNASRPPAYLLPSLVLLCFFSFSAILLYKVDDFASQTKTLAGHNLEPTPWHLFPRKSFGEESRRSQTYKILQCSYFSCPYGSGLPASVQRRPSFPNTPKRCPDFFRFIHRDLEPWVKTGITLQHVAEAQKYAAFRVLILQGKLYVDLYYACVQSRMMFTVWGLLQMLKRYPGMVPDVDIMFDCMDKPSINKTEHMSLPLPLFRYCTNEAHFDIPFPDWSFWGWSETNIRPWNQEFKDIKRGSLKSNWSEKIPQAYWKGNPDVLSPIRLELLKCNDSGQWGAQIMRQNWGEAIKRGFEQSKLSAQCNYRYKIYAEGFAWSVSLKYIISCGSMTLIITPEYEDFFSRGLIPKQHYWPVSPKNLCPSIKYAVDWGNENPSEAEAIGRSGQNFMATLDMKSVYDYMFHLITEYSKLQTFKPTRPSSAREVCTDSLLCFAEPREKKFLRKSSAKKPLSEPPCTLPIANRDFVENWIQTKKKTIEDLRFLEMVKEEGDPK